MDQNQFDGLTRTVGAAVSRRALGRALTGMGLGFGVFGLPEIAEAKSKPKNKKKATKNKKKRQGPTQTLDPGTAPPSQSPPSPPPPPGPVLTYQCPGPKNDSVSGDGIVRFAQMFTAERSGSLQQIQFSVGKKPATTGDYLVQLLRVIGGKPSHSPTDVLASLTVPDAAVATSSDATLTATFAGPVLVAGTEYAATFSRPGSTNVTANSRKGDGSACGGKWYIANGAGVFNEALAQDSLVSVLVN